MPFATSIRGAVKMSSEATAGVYAFSGFGESVDSFCSLDAFAKLRK
jgi:hypothetical protein